MQPARSTPSVDRAVTSPVAVLLVAMLAIVLAAPVARAQAGLETVSIVPVDTLSLPSTGLRGIAFRDSTVFLLMTSNTGLSVADSTVDAAILEWDREAGTIDTLSAEPGAFDSGLTYDGEGLWAGGYRVGGAEALYRVEMDGTLSATLPAAGYHPCGLVWDDEYLWQVDGDARQIARIEPEEGKVSRRVPTEAFYPTGLAYDGYHFWNADAATGRVIRVRAYNGRADGVVDTEVLSRPGEYLTLGWDGRMLWAAAATDRVIVRYAVLR